MYYQKDDEIENGEEEIENREEEIENDEEDIESDEEEISQNQSSEELRALNDNKYQSKIESPTNKNLVYENLNSEMFNNIKLEEQKDNSNQKQIEEKKNYIEVTNDNERNYQKTIQFLIILIQN